MPITVTCTCGKKLSAPDEAAGHRIRCPACNRILSVSAQAEPVVEATVVGEPLASVSKEPLPGAPEPPTRPFSEELGRAFLYPLRGTGLILLAIIATIRLASVFVGFGVFGVFAIIAMLFLILYLSAHFLSIVQASAGGDENMPPLPDATELWEDILKPVLLLWWAALVSLVPVVLYGVYVLEKGDQADPVVMALLRACGSVYFPMAVMSVAVSRSFAGVSPHVVVPAILRIPGQHLLMAASVWLIWSGYEHLHKQVTALGAETIATAILQIVLPFLLLVYFSWVVGRIIGITHWVYRKELGWFRTI